MMKNFRQERGVPEQFMWLSIGVRENGGLEMVAIREPLIGPNF